eukprot:g8962.t1
MEKEWFTGFWSARWQKSNVPRDIKDFLFYTNNFIEAWHKVLKTLALRNKKNKRLDLLHMVCVERMQRICARAMYDVDLTKERKRMFHTVDLTTRVYGKDHLLYEDPDTDSQEGIYFAQFGTNIFTVRLGGEFGDGPTCTCKDPDPWLCLHIIIVYYDARVYYTAEQWSDWGWQGNQDDRVYLTLRGMSLVLQEGDDDQEADDDNSNFDNDDNHDNSQAKTDDELKHVFKEITDGLDVLFEKLRLVPYKTRERWKPALYLKMQDGLFKPETNRRTLLMKRPNPHAAGPPKSAKTDLPERRLAGLLKAGKQNEIRVLQCLHEWFSAFWTLIHSISPHLSPMYSLQASRPSFWDLNISLVILISHQSPMYNLQVAPAFCASSSA